MKKIYLRPVTLLIHAEVANILAGSGDYSGQSSATVGGGTDGSSNKETSGSGAGGDGEFEGGLHSKGYNAWEAWDEF
nr:hypothetical protein [uncultured Prevotella sp.]